MAETTKVLGNGHANGNGRAERIPGSALESDYRFPASKKVYVPGTLFPDVRVPMREIALTPTRGIGGGPAEENPPLRVYDTSGPYTDPTVAIDIRQGLPRLREPWIRSRPGATYEEVEPSYRPVAGHSDRRNRPSAKQHRSLRTSGRRRRGSARRNVLVRFKRVVSSRKFTRRSTVKHWHRQRPEIF